MNFPLSRTIKILFPRLFFKSEGWNFSEKRLHAYVLEYQDWLENYLPISVKGLTILDVGAGEGETARFYLEHGAKKVLCIEPHHESYLRLAMNAKNRPMVCFNKRFTLSDLQMQFDFMKMDIEGYEEPLLNVQFTKPCVIEVHGLQLRDKFAKAGWIIKKSGHHDFGSTDHAYKNLPYMKRALKEKKA